MDGTAGAGVYEESLPSEMKIPLRDKITVFQAEIYAIYMVLTLPYKRGGSTGPFISNQKVIRALVSSRITSKLVQKCIQMLNRLDRNNMKAMRLANLPICTKYLC
jgi:hypothetical protein